MKSQETLGKIMELLNLQDEVKLESMKLENGTTIEAEAFEANQEVFIVTEDEKIALPVGEYEMEDGRILVVAEEGVIAEMRDAGEEAPEEAPAEEPAQEEATEEVEANEEEEMSYATKEELSAAVEEMKAMIEEIKAMMSPKEEEMAEEEVEMSADEPAAKPIKHSPDSKPVEMHQFSKGAKGDTLSRIFNKLG
jgi:crotonobetainyl-CoA:carnitine CoA-transferase CaiB-like acyl-CoA transferase